MKSQSSAVPSSIPYLPEPETDEPADEAAESNNTPVVKNTRSNGDNEEEKSQYIAGIAVIAATNTVMACTSAGRCVRVNVGKTLNSDQAKGGKENANTLLKSDMTTQFFYHVGIIEGLCTSTVSSTKTSLITTAGADKRIYVWDICSKKLIARYISKLPVKSVAFDNTGSFLAVGFDLSNKYLVPPGSSTSTMAMFHFTKTEAKKDEPPSEFSYTLKLLFSRKDAKEYISDVKFSPNNTKLAAGSGDNFIYVYSCTYETSKCILRPLLKLSGHSSFITHIGTCSLNYYRLK